MVNNTTLMGRLTKDPELKELSDTKCVLSSSLAFDGRKDKEGNKTSNFINFEAWDGAARIINSYCNKGSLLVLVGELKQDTWTDDNGNKRSDIRLVVRDVTLCDSKKDGTEGEKQPAVASTSKSKRKSEDYDPFED